MSWSHHVGNTRKNQSKWDQSRLPNSYSIKNHRRHSIIRPVSTSVKVITCALAIMLIAAPVIAATQHVSCQPAQQANMRGVLVSSSWPSTYKVADLFMNAFPEIPGSFKVTQGLTDFFEDFVQKYNVSRKENYPHLPPKKVGQIVSDINKEDKLALARFLFSIYEEVETGSQSHGCLWRSKINVIGTCFENAGKTSRVVVDYIRSSLLDFRKPKIVSEDQDGVIVERKTYEAVQQQAIITFQDDDVLIEVVSHIQDEKFDPPLELRHQEENEPNCAFLKYG